MVAQLEYTAMASSSWWVVMPMPGLWLNNWRPTQPIPNKQNSEKGNGCFYSVPSAMFMKIRLLNLTLKFLKSPWGASHVLRCTLAQAGPIKLHGGAAQMKALSLSLRCNKMVTKCTPRALSLQNGMNLLKWKKRIYRWIIDSKTSANSMPGNRAAMESNTLKPVSVHISWVGEIFTSYPTDWYPALDQVLATRPDAPKRSRQCKVWADCMALCSR